MVAFPWPAELAHGQALLRAARLTWSALITQLDKPSFSPTSSKVIPVFWELLSRAPTQVDFHSGQEPLFKLFMPSEQGSRLERL
jgi:hypothetical protein